MDEAQQLQPSSHKTKIIFDEIPEEEEQKDEMEVNNNYPNQRSDGEEANNSIKSLAADHNALKDKKN